MARRGPTKAQLVETLAQERAQSTYIEEQLGRLGLLESGNIQESLAELELGLEDVGWVRESMQAEREFSRMGLQRIIYRSRLAYIKDPLIRNGVNIQAHYVWAQGAEIRAKHPLVNAKVVQPFLDDRQNARALTGHKAHMNGERMLATEGNIVFALFTDLQTGFVRVRKIPIEQVKRTVTNPDDRDDVWYYERRWHERDANASLDDIGAAESRVAYHPDWMYQPSDRPDDLNGVPIMWDAPIYHVKVGELDGMAFGIPEVYTAIDWGNAVKRDLEDYASVRRALARFAWSAKVGGGATAVKRTRDKLATTLDPSMSAIDTNPPPAAGSFAVTAPGNSIEPIKTAGAQQSPNDSHRLWLQVSAAMGIPHTMLAGDANAGSWATAKTLDRPTELKMVDRQELWSDVFRDILNYAIDQAILAPAGPLEGDTLEDPYTGQDVIVIGPDEEAQPGEDGSLPATDRSLVIKFASILQRDTKEHIDAIMHGATMGNLTGYPAGTIPAWQANNIVPKKLVSGLIMTALGVDDVDEVLDAMYGDDPTMGSGSADDPLIAAIGTSTGGAGEQSTVEAALGALRAVALQLREAAVRNVLPDK